MTRFPTYPPDILSRADALLSEKYPDGIVDPRLVEIACEAMMMEQEHMAALLKDPAAVRLNYLRGGVACQKLIDEAVAAENERCAVISEMHSSRGDIAKAIRGTK